MNLLRGMALMLGALTVASAAENPTVQMLDREFTLAVIDAREAFILNEYVLPGESTKEWTQLLTIMHVPRTSQPSLAARSLLKSALAGGLLANKPLMAEREGAKKGTDMALILIFRDPADGRLEYKVQRYVKVPGVPGIMSYRFSRHYAADEKNLPDGEEISFWVKALWAMETAVLTKPPK